MITPVNPVKKAELIAKLHSCSERTLTTLRKATVFRQQKLTAEEAEQELIDANVRDPGDSTASDIRELKRINAWQALWETCMAEGQ